MGAVGHIAADMDGGAPAALAGPSGVFLGEGLLASAADLGHILGVGRTLALIIQVFPDRQIEEMLIGLDAEDLLRQLGRARLLALAIVSFHCDHICPATACVW